MSTTLTIPTAVDSLLGAYRAHVLGRTLPVPVALGFTPSQQEIDVQPGGGVDLCSHLASMLVWAHTLSDVTARWWHTSDHGLHVTILGRTAGGTRMRVYGGGDFSECHGLVRLATGQKEGVSLDELYTLVGLLREATRDAQHDRVVA
jgi:hypothetical protein